MQIYLLGLFLLVLAVVQIQIVRTVIGRRRAGEPWMARGPEGARREPVYKAPPKPKPQTSAPPASAGAASPEAPSSPGSPRSAFASGPGKTVERPVAKLPPRPKSAPDGAVAPDVEARLEWAFDLLQTGKIPLESYVRIVEAERDQVKIKLARLRESGDANEHACAGLEAALEVFGWCLDWADLRARSAA